MLYFMVFELVKDDKCVMGSWPLGCLQQSTSISSDRLVNAKSCIWQACFDEVFGAYPGLEFMYCHWQFSAL